MKTQLKRSYYLITILLAIAIASMAAISACSKDDDDDDDDNGTDGKDYALVIENGAQTIQPGATMNYSAILVDTEGNAVDASSKATVTWSTSNGDIAAIDNSGNLTVAGTGSIKITATASINDKELTASVPLGIYAPGAFTVAPSAIIYEKGGSVQLEAIHLSTSGAVEPNCTYASDDESVATVSSDGLVEFIGAGECVITVTATDIDGNPVVYVPVMVVGAPEVELPITRIEVNPPAKDLFKDETQTLTAKAYKSDDSQANDVSFTWTSLNPSIAEVDNNGKVTPLNTGTTYIQASTSGVIGQAEIIVNPDTLVLVEPFYTSMGAGSTKQFTATAYHITRTSATPYENIAFEWFIPTYGISLFDIATVNSNGLVTMNDDAMPGMMTFVGAYDQNNTDAGGVATIMVAIAGDCDCGDGNPDVNNIEIANTDPIEVSLTSGETVQLDATAYDASGSVVSEPNLVYCTNNIAVADIDDQGMITPTGEGSTTIKVCSGDYAEATITINVSLMK